MAHQELPLELVSPEVVVHEDDVVVLVLVLDKNHGVRFAPGTQRSVAPYIQSVRNLKDLQ